MKKVILTVLFSVLFLLSCRTQNRDDTQMSGKVEGGLRYIDIDNITGLNFKVYRGDYIVFKPGNGMSGKFEIKDLEISEILPKPQEEKPYIKMKKSGTYNFFLGDIEGTIEVIEFTGTNYKEVSASEANDIIKNIDPFILDVRTKGEYKAGHIDNSNLIPVQILSKNVGALEEFKNEPILIYCQSGNRSTVAGKILIDSGFTKIYNLRYGIGDWRSRGFPITKE